MFLDSEHMCNMTKVLALTCGVAHAIVGDGVVGRLADSDSPA